MNLRHVSQLEQLCDTLSHVLDRWIGQLSSSSDSDPHYRPDVRAAYRRIKNGMGSSPDVVLRWVEVEKDTLVLLAYIDELVDNQVVDQDILSPIVQTTRPAPEWGRGVFHAGDVQTRDRWSDILNDLAMGNTLVFASDCPHVWSLDTVKYKQRAITRPETEMTVRGPDEAFNEVVWTQMAQLRRRLPTPALRFHPSTLGAQQNIVVAYLDGVTNPVLVKEIVDRLSRVTVDVVVNATMVGGMIRDHPESIFPTIRSTERVDLAAWGLAEGKVLVLVSGDPFVLIAPAPLVDFYRTSMDYAGVWYDSSFVRMIRWAGWAVGVYLPAFYIAVTQVDSNVLPAGMLIVLAGSRAGLPITPLTEVVVMIFAIEILREAALRLPKVLATTIGTVGAIVLGTAVVKAGIVSPQIIVLITLTALAFYSAPVYDLTGSWRLVNFTMLGAAAALGLFGITLVSMLLIIELSRLTSFGTPYFEPWAPFRPRDWGDALIRLPWSLLSRRPSSARPLDPGWPEAPKVTPPPLRKGWRQR